MVFIVREIVKVIMFTLLWGIPTLLAYINEDSRYLWFFLMSVIVTGFLFGHYETLERIDNRKFNCDKTPNKDD